MIEKISGALQIQNKRLWFDGEMGSAGSTIRGQLKRVFIRYNAENRAHKFLEQEKLPPAPSHFTNKDLNQLLKENPQLKKELEELNLKNEQLDEYLKKVYLTSDPEEKVESKRPLPVKREFDLPQMFFEPEKPSKGYCTFTNIIDIMVKYQENPKQWNAVTLANHFNLSKESVVKLLTYYSLLKKEDLQFMNQEKPSDENQKRIEFEILTPLEKKPLKQIEGKKEKVTNT